MDSGLESEIGETSSNPTLVRCIHLFTNTYGKRMIPSTNRIYGLNSMTYLENIVNLQKKLIHY